MQFYNCWPKFHFLVWFGNEMTALPVHNLDVCPMIWHFLIVVQTCTRVVFITYTSSFHLSYHQKYLLRQQRDVLQALNLSDEELIRSHAACRLNGYCGGYGKLDELEKELPQFNLSANAQQRVKILTQRGAQM